MLGGQLNILTVNLLFSTFNRIRKALGCSWEELVPND